MCWFFIGPESDHWLCLSVTHSLSHSVAFSRLDGCEWCQLPADVVTFCITFLQLVKAVKLSTGGATETIFYLDFVRVCKCFVEVWSKLNFKFIGDADVWLSSWLLVEILKMKFDQDSCLNLWYDLKKLFWWDVLNPRVRCAFGNVFSFALPKMKMAFSQQVLLFHEVLHLREPLVGSF